jgi:photosystem II stability/assembly factor-like uncharacterized protein
MVALAAAGTAIAGTSTAHASHPPRMPRVERVLVHPEDSARMVIATRFGGYYVTRDGGRSFAHVCQEGMGYDDTEVYPGHYATSGRVTVSTGYSGIASSGDGCGWTVWAPPGPVFIADVVEVSGSKLLALNGANGAAGFENQVWASADDGRSWHAQGVPLAPELMVFGVAGTPDAERLFVTARSPAGLALLRSTDAGASWSRVHLSDDVSATPRLVGMVAGAPEQLVVLLAHEQVDTSAGADIILISRDGGDRFEVLFQGTHGLPAATLTREGVLWFGGPEDGLWSVQLGPSSAAPRKVSDTPTRGLTWAQGRLFSIGDENADGHSVGVSSDGGRTFSKLFSFCDAHSALACAPDTEAGALCSSGIETEMWQPLGEDCARNNDPPGAPEGGAPAGEELARGGEVRGVLCSAGPFAPARMPFAGRELMAWAVLGLAAWQRRSVRRRMRP